MNWNQYANLKDVVLFLLAIYAAILSTLNFVQARRKERRSIRVRMSTSLPAYGPELGPPHLTIEAVNDGHREVTVDTLTIELPDGGHLATFTPGGLPGYPDTPLPARLGEGDVARKLFSYGAVGRALLGRGISNKIAVTPVCKDTVGGQYRGAPWEVDPHEWVRMSEI